LADRIGAGGILAHLGSDRRDAGLDLLEDKSLLLILDAWRAELLRPPAKAPTTARALSFRDIVRMGSFPIIIGEANQTDLRDEIISALSGRGWASVFAPELADDVSWWTGNFRRSSFGCLTHRQAGKRKGKVIRRLCRANSGQTARNMHSEQGLLRSTAKPTQRPS